MKMHLLTIFVNVENHHYHNDIMTYASIFGQTTYGQTEQME